MSLVYLVSEEALIYDHTPEEIWNPVGVFTRLEDATDCQQRKTDTRLKTETFDLDKADGHLVKPGFITRAVKSRRDEGADWIRSDPFPTDADQSEPDGFVRWSEFGMFNDGVYDELHAWAPTAEGCIELRESAIADFAAGRSNP